MTKLTKYFNVKNYFDQHNAKLETILKFKYIKKIL